MNNTRVEFLLLKYLNVSLSLCGLKGAIKATIPERRESKAKQSKAKRLLQGLGNFPDSRDSLPGVIKTLSWQIRRSLLEYGQDFEVVVKICSSIVFRVFGLWVIWSFYRHVFAFFCVLCAVHRTCTPLPVSVFTERAVRPEKNKARNRRSLKSPDKGFDDHLFFFLAYYSQIIEGKYRKQISQIGVLVFLSPKTNCFLCLSSFSHTSQVLLPVDCSVWCEMLCLSWHPAFNTW